MVEEVDISRTSETDSLLDNKPTRSSADRQKASKRWITVEPVVLLLFASLVSVDLIKVQYIHARVMENYNYTSPEVNGSNSSACRNRSENSNVLEVEVEIQQDSARWLLLLNCAGAVPGVVATLILGALSDRMGRKKAMMVGSVGCTFYSAITMVVTVFHLPLEVLYVAEVMESMCGGGFLALAAAFAYIADVTTEDNRSFRIIVLEAVLYTGVGLIQIGFGYLIDSVGYVTPCVICLVLNFLVLAYLMCPGLLIESNGIKRAYINPEYAYNELRRAFRAIAKLIYNDLAGCRRTCDLLLLCFIGLMLFITTLKASEFILYVEAKPFCWSSETVGYYIAFYCILILFGNIGGFKVLTRCFSDPWIFQFSCWSIIAANVATGLSRTTASLFLVRFMGVFGGLSIPIVRSALSKLVQPQEHGAVFSLFGCVENIGSYMFPIALNAIYLVTVPVFPAFIFLLVAMVSLISSVLFAIFQFISWRRARSASPVIVDTVAK